MASMNYGVYGSYGHNAIMAIGDMALASIDAIIDQGQGYRFLMKRLDLKIAYRSNSRLKH